MLAIKENTQVNAWYHFYKLSTDITQSVGPSQITIWMFFWLKVSKANHIKLKALKLMSVSPSSPVKWVTQSYRSPSS